MFETTVAGENGQAEWNQGEDELGRRRRRRWRRRRRYDYDEDDQEYGPGGAEAEDEYEDEDEDAGEEQFLPIIAAGLKLLPAILGGLGGGRKEAEFEEGEEGEDEERFIGDLLKKFLGEAEYEDESESPLSPAQEAELAGRLLEVSGEDELKQVLGKIVNAVGSEVQGVRNAASSPQGRALVEAMTPVARTVVPSTGLSPGEVFETETSGMSQEQEVFESARQAVRLAAAAAQNVASAPPGAPAEVVGELGIIRAASRLARPLFGRALRAFSPLARRALGIRRHPGQRGGYRYGRPSGRYYGGYRGPRYYGGYRGPRYRGYGYGYGYGYPPPAGYPVGPPPEPMGPPPAASPEPPAPPQPGYRWVAVPIGAPPPPVVPPEPAPPGPAAPPEAAPPGGPAQPAQSEWNQSEWNQGEWNQGEWNQGEWNQGEWEPGEYQSGGYGAGEAPGMSGPDGDGQTGRWVRRSGKIIILGA